MISCEWYPNIYCYYFNVTSRSYLCKVGQSRSSIRGWALGRRHLHRLRRGLQFVVETTTLAQSFVVVGTRGTRTGVFCASMHRAKWIWIRIDSTHWTKRRGTCQWHQLEQWLFPDGCLLARKKPCYHHARNSPYSAIIPRGQSLSINMLSFDVFALHCYPLALLYNTLHCLALSFTHARRQWTPQPPIVCPVTAICQACQALCAKTSGCGHFSYWSDGGCLLTSETAHAIKHSGVISGGPTCGASDTYHEPAYKGPSVMKVAPRGGMDPPTHVQQYNGVAWPTMKITDNKDDFNHGSYKSFCRVIMTNILEYIGMMNSFKSFPFGFPCHAADGMFFWCTGASHLCYRRLGRSDRHKPRKNDPVPWPIVWRLIVVIFLKTII